MFAPVSVELSGGLTVSAPVDAAFELFSPLGETRWVPGWQPELLYPPGAQWERGQLFRTREERGEAIWVITALDRERHEVEYHRVESGRYVAKVQVRCVSAGRERTEVTVTYTFVGLSDSGNQEIAAMSQVAFDDKMTRWRNWIEQLLSAR